MKSLRLASGFFRYWLNITTCYKVTTLFLATSALFAQELPYAWNSTNQPITSLTPGGLYTIQNTVIDLAGNLYTVGKFSDLTDFDPSSGTTSLTTTGPSDFDVFFAKYTANGQLVFVKQIGSSGDDEGSYIFYDTNADAVYVTGQFSGTVDLNPGPGVTTVVSAGNTDIFVAKFDPLGNFFGGYAIGGTGSDAGTQIRVYGNDVYLTGYYSGTFDFDPAAGVTTLTSAGATDIFLARYTSSGGLVWTKSIGGSGADAPGMLRTADNFVYLSTLVSTTAIDFDPGVGIANVLGVNGTSDVVFAKYDLSGNFGWVRSIGGPGFESGGIQVIDGSDIFVSGSFQQTIDLDPGIGITLATSIGGPDGFICRVNTSGDLVWSRTWASPNETSTVVQQILSSNTLLVTGDFTGSIDLDPGPGVFNQNSQGFTDGFFLRMDLNGNFQDGFSIGGTAADPIPGAISDGTFRFYISGGYSETVDFDPTTDFNGVTRASNTTREIFVSAYSILSLPVPSAQPTSLGFSAITASSVNYSFTVAAGAPAGYIVVRKSGSAPTGIPKDGQAYIVGSSIGDGVVVQSSSSTSGTASLLSANSNYYFQVYSYNGGGLSTNYLTSAPLQGNISTSVLTYTLTTDSVALVSIYNSLGGNGWTTKTNWLTGALNTWVGVTITAGRVTSLSLPNNNLVGQIPTDIGNLTAMQTIDLHSNSISGSIPVELASITGLTNVTLYLNKLSGAIPQEIGNLNGLIYFDVTSNNLTGVIPSSFANLTSLGYLYLGSNNLSGTIDPIKNLTSLTQLWLFDNQFTGSIPPELGSMSSLLNLSLSRNKFTGSIPSTLGNLTVLQSLQLAANQLTGSIPSAIGNITSLTDVDLGDNQLTGAVPSQFSNLINLTSFKLGYNGGLTGSVPVNSSFTQLMTLDVSSNRFDALADLSSITSLTTLSVADNAFTFEDLEPNAGFFPDSTYYYPQAPFGAVTDQSIPVGQPLNLTFSVGGASNVYKWKLGGAKVGTNSNSFSIPAIATSDAGTYTLTITNPLLPGLILTSANQVVAVMAQNLFQWVAAGDLTSEGFQPTPPQLTDENYGGQWGDYNNDGFEDLFVVGVSPQERNYLYKNNGDGTFTKAPASSYFFTAGRGVAWADYNNDGFLDAFCPGGGFAPDSLSSSYILKNNGNSTFTKIALPGNPVGDAGVWADTDNDGDVDLIVNGGLGFPVLFRNDGGNNFVPLSAFSSGSDSQWSNVGVDANNDGKMDIFFPDDAQRSFYFGNGDNTFSINSSTPMVTDALGSVRGISWADIDNDGDFDAVAVTNLGHRFYINNGTGVFTPQTSLAILGQNVTGARGSAFADYDNDGYVDLLIVQGNTTPAGLYLFKNNGNGTFTKQTNQTFKAGYPFSGASFGDFNNDGFLDIFSASFGQDYNGLYKNNGNSNHWLQVKLRGVQSNRSAIGAKISVKAGGFWRHQQILTANGFANQNSLIAQFGLGTSTVADSIKIQWPSGFKQVSTNVPANQRTLITEINYDSLALVSLYNGAGGASWQNQVNWLKGPLKNWFGVTVRQNRVTNLVLIGNNLSGPFPSAITNLSRLDTLMLIGNNLTGSIPAAIGSLTNLKYIDLASNQFTGSLPASIFNLTQLNTLGIRDNRLSGVIPPAVGYLVNLKNFWIDSNQFSGALPTEINNLTKIQNFYIQSNQFTSIPTLSGFTLIGGSVQNNFLNFNSLQPNSTVPNLQFNPQNPIPVGDTVNVTLGAPVSITYDAGGTGTVYQWYKNLLGPIANDVSNTHQVAATVPSSAGQYYLSATNPALPGVTIQTTYFTIQVLSPNAAEDSGYKFWKKLGAEALGIPQLVPNGRASVDNLGNYYFTSPTGASNGSVIQKTDASGKPLYTIFSGNQDIGGTDIAIDNQNSVYVPGPGYATMKKYNSSGTLVYETPSYGGSRPFQTITVALDGSILAMDVSGSPVVKQFDSSTGNLIGQISLTGGPVSFYYSVFDFDIDASGNIYVTDATRIDKYSPAGVFISSVDVSMLNSWGGLILQIASNGDLYVATWFVGNIYHFDASGNLLGNFGLNNIGFASLKISSNEIIASSYSNGILKFDLSGNFLGFAEPRNANGQFSYPNKFAIDSKGNRYISDVYNTRVQKFDSKGNFILSFGSQGSGNGQFNNPRGIAVDRFDNVYVTDNVSNKIQKFSSAGVFIQSFGSTGTSNGQFSFPFVMATSRANQLVIADGGNSRVQILDINGNFISTFGSSGTGQGQFQNMNSLAVENDGSILVGDSPNNNSPRIQRFTPQGQFVNAIDMTGAVQSINGLAADADGAIYIAEQVVKKFDKAGGLITTIGTLSSQSLLLDGQLRQATDLSSNLAGDTIWISDAGQNRVSIFSAKFRHASASDSLALVDLYNNTNGPGWTIKTNWLTGSVDTWYGVNMSGGKIIGLTLSNNLLNGTLPSSLTTLDNMLGVDLSQNKISGQLPDWNGSSAMQALNISNNLLSATQTLPLQLQTLNFSNNQLTAMASLPTFVITADLSGNKLAQLGNMTSASISTLKVENNKLQFGDLEPNITIPTFTYTPQDTVDVFQSVLKQIGVTQTFTASLTGTANSYQWQKSGTDISGATNSSLTLSNITFKDDATYGYSATNSIVKGLTLVSQKKILRVSSIQRDSIALTALYNATNGSSWTNNSNWTTTPLSTGNWFGVTISNNRVTTVNLPSNNLTGVVPKVFGDAESLTTVDLSGNKITTLPDLTTLDNLTSFNVSSNNLDFASLLSNVGLAGASINYASQGNLGVPLDTLVTYGTDFTVKVSTRGKGNVYQWTRNGSAVSGATDTTYLLSKINRSNMGTYVCEVTNPGVPNLKLTTFNQRAQAVATISGSFVESDNTPVGKGNIYLFKVNSVGAYDTAQVKALSADGTFSLSKVVLDDYVLLGKPDTTAFPTVLPSYYKNTIFWQQADTLQLQGNRTGIDILAVTKPTPDKGTGEITGTLDDVATTSGGRVEAGRRVSGAGVSASRGESSGKVEAGKYTLVAYTLTDANGVFVLSHLSAGSYRLDIQYPGYPMDTTSFITFTIGTTPSTKQVIVAAAVDGGKIVVKLLKITGVEEDHRFSIYPNPTKLAFNIDLNETMDGAHYAIIDMLGEKVKSGNLISDVINSIDVSALKSGLYIVEILQGDKSIKSFRIEIKE